MRKFRPERIAVFPAIIAAAAVAILAENLAAAGIYRVLLMLHALLAAGVAAVVALAAV